MDFIRRNTNSVKWDLAGEGVLPLWVADMDFPVAAEIVQALEQRLRHPYLGYGLTPESLYEALIAWIGGRQGWIVQREWLGYVPSVMVGMSLAIEQFSEMGEGVIVPSPVYFPFFATVRSKNRILIDLPLEHSPGQGRFVFNFNRLEELASRPENNLLLLCNPHNPVGRVWNRDELGQLVDICLRHGVFIVADEIHADIVFPGHRFVPLLPLLQERGREEMGLALQSPGKTFNIAGISSASFIAPAPGTVKKMERAAQNAGLDIPNVLALCAAEAAYREGGKWFRKILGLIESNIRLVEGFVDERLRSTASQHEENASHAPEGTYLYWLDLRKIVERRGLSDRESIASLKKKAKIWPSPGYLFSPRRGSAGAESARAGGSSGFFRLNLACPEELLVEGLARLHDWMLD